MNFLPTIEAFRNSNADNLIANLYKMFSQISKMDDDELVASFQTLVAVAEERGLTSDPMIHRLLNALRIEMIENDQYSDRFKATIEQPLEKPIGYWFFFKRKWISRAVTGALRFINS